MPTLHALTILEELRCSKLPIDTSYKSAKDSRRCSVGQLTPRSTRLGAVVYQHSFEGYRQGRLKGVYRKWQDRGPQELPHYEPSRGIGVASYELDRARWRPEMSWSKTMSTASFVKSSTMVRHFKRRPLGSASPAAMALSQTALSTKA